MLLKSFIIISIITLGLQSRANSAKNNFTNCFSHFSQTTKTDTAVIENFCATNASDAMSIVADTMIEPQNVWSYVDGRYESNSPYFYHPSSILSVVLDKQTFTPANAEQFDHTSKSYWYFKKTSIVRAFELRKVWPQLFDNNSEFSLALLFKKYYLTQIKKISNPTDETIFKLSRNRPRCTLNLFYSKLNSAVFNQKIKNVLNNKQFPSDPKFGRVLTLFQAAKVCSDVGTELVECGINYTWYQNNDSTSNIKDYLRICNNRMGITGDLSQYGDLTTTTTKGTLDTPNISFSDAWEQLKVKDANSLESIQAVKVIISELKQEWDHVSKSSPSAYDDLNRQLVPLFMYTRTEIKSLPLSTLLKFKIDLQNNFDSIFGPIEKSNLFNGKSVNQRNAARERIKFLISDF